MPADLPHDPTHTAASAPSDAPTTSSLPEMADDPTFPPAIPGFHVLREIHRGGQGVVYEAVQENPPRKVAIKVVRADPSDRERFAREIAALARLRHPNVVSIFASGMTGTLPYLVMEYLPGETLATRLTSAPFPISEALEFFTRLADALAEAHRRGIVHRDLKPGNVRFDAQRALRVLDFGLARFARDPGDVGQLTVTQTGHFVGSLPWASPEQAIGRHEQVGPASDVYALGVIAYQMLTGLFPYGVRGEPGAVRENILSTPPTPLRQVRSDIPTDLQTIVLCCLAKLPEHRYQDAAELLEDLRRFAAGAAIRAQRESAAARLAARARTVLRCAPRLAYSAVIVACVALGFFLKSALPENPVDRRFEAMAVAWSAAARAPALASEVVPLVIDDASAAALPQLCAERGVPYDPGDRGVWRSLHGSLLDRLAVARPRVVVWDLLFVREQPAHDAAFVRGLRALDAAGVPSVFAVSQLLPDGRPALAASILPEVRRWGWLQLWQSDGQTRGAPRYVCEPTHGCTPSLSLAAYAAYRAPEALPVVLPPSEHALTIATLRYAPLDPARPPPASERFSAPLLVPNWLARDARDASESVATVAWLTLPPPADLAAARLGYSEALSLPQADLTRRVADRIVVILDARTAAATPAPDRGLIADAGGGREEAHGFAHAAAISDLLRGAAVQRPNLVLNVCFLLAIVLIGRSLSARIVSGKWLACAGVLLCAVLPPALLILARSTQIVESPLPLAAAGLASIFLSRVVAQHTTLYFARQSPKSV